MTLNAPNQNNVASGAPNSGQCSLLSCLSYISQVFLFTCVSTYLGFIQPAFNAFFLMTLGIPAVVMMVYNIKKEESERVNSLGRRSIGESKGHL